MPWVLPVALHFFLPTLLSASSSWFSRQELSVAQGPSESGCFSAGDFSCHYNKIEMSHNSEMCA